MPNNEEYKRKCHADSDGDCEWCDCPQLKDGEPAKTGRHCPLDIEDDANGMYDD